MNLSMRFGDVCPIGEILMRDWQGERRDIAPVINAIRDFDVMGLRAALEFRYNEKMQDLVLGPLPKSRGRDALMFLFYDQSMDLSKGISSWDSALEKLLAENTPEKRRDAPCQMTVVELDPFYQELTL